MPNTLQALLYRRWPFRSLMSKLLWPIAGLMIFSLLAGTLAFVASTALIQRELLRRQTTSDAAHIANVMNTREQELASAAHMLANSAEIISTAGVYSEDAMTVLNRRAVAVRDRFDLHLVQIYNGEGELRANLVVSDLYRESALSTSIHSNHVTIRAIDEHLLLLSRATMPGQVGFVICGIDLDIAFRRLVQTHRLVSDLGLTMDGVEIRTRDGLQLDRSPGESNDTYRVWVPIELGGATLDLLLSRSMTDVTYVMATGLLVMVLSMAVTTILVLGLSFLLARSIARPVQDLCAAAQALAEGNLDHQVVAAGQKQLFKIGSDDEIGVLATAFNVMVTRLRNLYQTLEAKVDARTRELATAADVAQAVSSSLDLDTVLRGALQVIREQLELDQVYVLLVTDDGDMMISSQCCGNRCDGCVAETCTVPIGPGSMVSVVAGSGQSAVTQELATDPAFSDMDGNCCIGSAAAVPILADDVVIGVLYARSLDNDYFAAGLVRLLDTLADQLTVGLQNVRLFETLQERMHDLEQAQAQLIQSEKMAAVGQLAAGIAHDFNNLLTAITGYTALLLTEDLAPAVQDDLRAIEKAAERAASLTSQLLAFSRKQVIRPEVLDLGCVVSNMEEMLSRMIGEHITLEMHLEATRAAVHVDPGQLEQVLMNLVVNARDAIVELSAAQGGTITIRTANTELRDDVDLPPDVKPGAYVQLQVSDTGIGMEPEVLSHLFEPFFTTKEIGKGTGLGLATVYGIIKQNGGHIKVESEPKKGAMFSIYLPQAQACTEIAPPAKMPSSEQRHAGTILLVEDQDTVRRLTRRVLVSRGYSVLEAKDGVRAIEILDECTGQIDLLLVDIVMPGGISGFDVAVHALERFSNVRVLYMSGYNDEMISDQHALTCGNFIQKPFSPRDLAFEVGQALDSPADKPLPHPALTSARARW